MPLVAAATLGATAAARDFFLTIGGGPSPSSNQASLEKNVLYFERVLRTLGLADSRHDVLFSDGNDPGRDLQFYDPDEETPPANVVLAQLLQQEGGLTDQYRSHQVPAIRGPATRAEVDRWFEEVAPEIKPGDRLFVYFTGHGGRGSTPRANIVHLWNEEKLTVTELVTKLDRLPKDVPVTLVMVQCYSGGFANVIFEEAQTDKGATASQRCGFFATTHDRVAAGCTSDIDEENYQEYSSYFWAALAGATRTGSEIARPDYDHDGATSFEEAHCYALIESKTIDVSVRTSDALLRRFSKAKGDRPDLLTADSPAEALLAAASPADKAVYTALVEKLRLADQPAAGARKLASDLKKEKSEIDKERSDARKSVRKAAEEIVRSLKHRWPELECRWHPRIEEILSSESLDLLEEVESHPQFSDFEAGYAKIAELDEQSLELRRQAALIDRFLGIAERIALAANLSKVASPEQASQFESLLARERATLAARQSPSVAQKSD